MASVGPLARFCPACFDRSGPFKARQPLEKRTLLKHVSVTWEFHQSIPKPVSYSSARDLLDLLTQREESFLERFIEFGRFVVGFNDLASCWSSFNFQFQLF